MEPEKMPDHTFETVQRIKQDMELKAFLLRHMNYEIDRALSEMLATPQGRWSKMLARRRKRERKQIVRRDPKHNSVLCESLEIQREEIQNGIQYDGSFITNKPDVKHPRLTLLLIGLRIHWLRWKSSITRVIAR